MKYSEIRDLKGLDTACGEISKKIRAKGEEVLDRWEDVKESYSPTSMVASGIKSISHTIPFDRIILWGIRAFRSFLR